MTGVRYYKFNSGPREKNNMMVIQFVVKNEEVKAAAMLKHMPRYQSEIEQHI